jgi:putative transposase
MFSNNGSRTLIPWSQKAISSCKVSPCIFTGKFVTEEDQVNCPFCKNEKAHLRKKLTKLGYKTFYCGKCDLTYCDFIYCDLTYNERTGTPFNYLSIPPDVLFLILFYRLRYKLSLRDIVEIFLERGFEFTHEAVRDWEERFAHLFTGKLKAKRKSKTDLSTSWRIDETYLKVGKSQVYL